MLETANITAVVDAMTQGIGLFAEPPLSYVVILACIFAGVKIVRKLIKPRIN